MARSSWNFTSLSMKMGCLSYCWESRAWEKNIVKNPFVSNDISSWHRKPMEHWWFWKTNLDFTALLWFLLRNTDYRPRGPPCVLLGICPPPPVCNPLVFHFPTKCRTRIWVCSGDCSIEDRTADHHPLCCVVFYLCWFWKSRESWRRKAYAKISREKSVLHRVLCEVGQLNKRKLWIQIMPNPQQSGSGGTSMEWINSSKLITSSWTVGFGVIV